GGGPVFLTLSARSGWSNVKTMGRRRRGSGRGCLVAGDAPRPDPMTQTETQTKTQTDSQPIRRSDMTQCRTNSFRPFRGTLLAAAAVGAGAYLAARALVRQGRRIDFN